MDLMSLKELCESTGVSRRSIQGYEKAGLMKPAGRNKYGYLLYDNAALERAKFIKFLHELGFQLKEISVIIDAPEEILKQAVENRIESLNLEVDRLNQLIEEARVFVDGIE